jgi:hypothetical protein
MTFVSKSGICILDLLIFVKKGSKQACSSDLKRTFLKTQLVLEGVDCGKGLS